MKKKVDWDRLTPLGVGGKKTCRGLLAAVLAAGTVQLLWFVCVYGDCWRDARLHRSLGQWMPPFREVTEGSYGLLVLAACCMPVLALGFYLTHYQGGRPIYTMRRLPNPWELGRRCLALPGLGLLGCGLAALVLTGLEFGIYQWLTPLAYLP